MSNRDMNDILIRLKEIHILQSKLRNMFDCLVNDDNDEEFLSNTSSSSITHCLSYKTLADAHNDFSNEDYQRNRKWLNSKSDTSLPTRDDPTKRHPVTNKKLSERIAMILKSETESKTNSLDSSNHLQGSIRSSSIASDNSGCSEVTDESQASSKTILNMDASVQTTTYEKKVKRTKGFFKWKPVKLPTSGRHTRRKRRLNKALDKLLRRILQQMNYSPEYEGRVVVPYHHPGAKPRLVQIAPRAMNEVSETSRVISSATKVSVERALPSWIDRVNNAFRIKLKNCKVAPRGILKDLTGSETKVTKSINSAWQYFNCTDEKALLDLNDDDSSSPMCTISRQYPLRANTNLSLSRSRLSLFNFLCKNFQDLEAQKAIMGSIVYCIHHKDGCKWSDELRKLKAHLNTCKHDAVPCSNKCGAMIPRVLMEDHLKYTCAQRRARCDFCAKEFTGHTLEKHTGTCGYEPLYCENKCGMKVQRRHLGQHKLGECAKRLVACRYCNKEFVFDTLGAHHAKCGRFPVACPHRCETAVLPREDLEVHLKDHCTTHLLSCTFKDAGCRFKGNRFSLDKHLEESAKMHLSLMCSVVTKQQHQITSLKSAISKLSLNYTGTLIWKITDYAARMSEAKAKEGMELVSPPFYTSQYGYKLQASVFLNGNGTGEGSHISIYIKILPGEYDALLRWPFSHSVSFTMFDQTVLAEKACNIVESFIPDPTWKNFQRPSREPDSLGFGFPRFVSHEMVKKRHFVKDDTMFIRVKVDPSKIVAV